MSSNPVITRQNDAKARHQVALLGAETNQQLSMRVQDVTPGEGTPLHVHHDQAETFHVIAGQFRFQVGEEVITGGPGDTFHIPKGTAHCFLYEGDEHPGQLISVLTPGIHDGFIQEIPEAQANQASPDVLSTIADRNGASIIGPKLSPTTF